MRKSKNISNNVFQWTQKGEKTFKHKEEFKKTKRLQITNLQKFIHRKNKNENTTNEKQKQKQNYGTILQILNSAKLPQNNIFKEEKNAINSLTKDKNDNNINSRTANLLKTNDKHVRRHRHIWNTRKIPDRRKAKNTEALLKPLLESKKISLDMCDHQYPRWTLPRGYTMAHPKSTKRHPAVPRGRQQRISHTQPLKSPSWNYQATQRINRSSLKNAKQLAQQLNTKRVEEDKIFLSHIVISLFTNSPRTGTPHSR